MAEGFWGSGLKLCEWPRVCSSVLRDAHDETDGSDDVRRDVSAQSAGVSRGDANFLSARIASFLSAGKI